MKAKESKIAASDIEANDWIKFLMIGFYDGKEYRVFKRIDDYLDFLITKERNGTQVYFHNGGRYDFLFLIEKLLERGDVKFVNKSSGLISIVFRKGNIRIEFRDSYNLLPYSLEKLIEVYGIEEKKVSVDFNKEHKYSDKRLHSHLKNDCIALYKILKEFENREGFLSLTIASHAMKQFEKKFFKGDFWNVNDKFDNYFRTYYYRGGRVEVYKGFGKNLYYYDINSLYPYVMREKMPVGNPERTKKYQDGKIGFYKIKLEQDYEKYISILVVKEKNGNYYVKGRKDEIYYLISCELEEMIKEGVKFKVLDGYYFKSSDYLFNDYVEYYYSKKVNANNEIDKQIAKLMLNSLYGKFGQKLNGTTIEVDKGQGDYPIYDLENGLLLIDRKRNIKFKGVYIAAYITALARITHYKLMKEIGFEHIYYCDTDSIVCDKEIKTGMGIGELKLVDKIKEGVFLMPKVYGYINDLGKEYVHYKGFGRDYFSYSELKKLAKGELTELRQSMIRVLGFKEAIRRKNKILNSRGKFLKTALQEKILSFNYTRRQIQKDKKHLFITFPFYKDEIIHLKKDE